MLLTLLQSQGTQPPVEPPKIYQQIWIIDERKKGEPRKARRVIKKVKRQLEETVRAVELAKEIQQRQETLAQQKKALDLAAEQIKISFELFELEAKNLELQKAAEAYQAKIRLEEYVRAEYQKPLIRYQQELIRREQERVRKEREEAEELQMLLDYMMNEV